MNARLISLLTACGFLICATPASAHDAVEYLYDSLGRLTYVDMGEGKYIRYYYDVDSNLVARNIVGLTDTDGDFMDDAWEVAYFGDLSRDGTGDFDSDGELDNAEFIAQTDPVDNESTLRVHAVSTSAGPVLSFQWDTVLGLNYLIESNASLNLNSLWLAVDEVSGDGETATYNINLSDFDGTEFYRVRVGELPPFNTVE